MTEASSAPTRAASRRAASALRSDARDDKASRVKQIVEWLGADFDGVIVFDESHAMQNAAGGKNEVARNAHRLLHLTT